MRILSSVLAVVLAAGAVAHAQAPAAPVATAGTAAAAPAAVPDGAREPHGFTYDAGGRRDPFVSMLRRGSSLASDTARSRPPGLPGLSAGEITLSGILASNGGFIAMLEGVDKKTYIVRTGDRLLDGTVRAITADTMVIVQQVDDPLSSETQREVRKVLRQTEEAN